MEGTLTEEDIKEHEESEARRIRLEEGAIRAVEREEAESVSFLSCPTFDI